MRTVRKHLDLAECALYLGRMNLRDRLCRAMEAKGWTDEELRKASGVGCSVSSINRKLRGTQGIGLDDAKKLADALGIKLTRIGDAFAIQEVLGATVCWPALVKRRAS